ncbi:SMI1/KNR4 family protein [Clostridium sp. DJ247]|uniref:SMI1/KNR4 family protein n=1 Tax=Clostridium sp. DJ247 TaxID=2726188 RepID=UPI00162AD769|nr:SMI1/KNR4 family protein [Clostridium sp. DJ247]MBC2582908.1 SMI1/KNR4 family protein [Clostridium sp. DJ247]
MPQIVIGFYKEFSTINGIDIGGDVSLLSLEGIKYGNSELTPDGLLIKYWIVTIASTTGGNAICLDLNIINKV